MTDYCRQRQCLLLFFVDNYVQQTTANLITFLQLQSIYVVRKQKFLFYSTLLPVLLFCCWCFIHSFTSITTNDMRTSRCLRPFFCDLLLPVRQDFFPLLFWPGEIPACKVHAGFIQQSTGGRNSGKMPFNWYSDLIFTSYDSENAISLVNEATKTNQNWCQERQSES